ncbi:MAG TPA: GAF domain-containing protein, partial [Candidatus Hydrogenedentes bacterium]|nr:GAF domain-containing protein [Candidatus Hydrogenedentota bacterium]
QCIVGLFRDMTAQKLAEAEARGREQFLMCLAEISTELLAASDLNGALPKVLERLREVSGADRCYLFENHEDASGPLLTSQRFEVCAPGVEPQMENPDLHGFDYAAGGMGRWVQVLSDGGVIEGAVAAFPKPERDILEPQRILRILALPLHVGGKWWGFVGFDACRPEVVWSKEHAGLLSSAASAISTAIERKQTEQIIAEQQAKMAASARLSSLGAMASGVAHEINNPLAIISGGSEQLEELVGNGFADPGRIARITATISRNVARIQRIVRGLRNLSRDGASEEFRAASLRNVLEDTLEVCRARFEARDIALDVCEIPPELALECRSVQLSQALLNLLNNAHDAVENLEQKWVRVAFDDSDDSVELSVTDSGQGLPAKLADRIFEPFFTTKPVPKGTGLGLSIAKGIIEAHQGELTLDADSANTRFVVRLPKRQSACAR